MRPEPLVGGLFAILCRGATVLSGQQAVLGGLSAMLRGSQAVLSGALDDLHTKVRPARGLLIRGVAPRHRQIARGGSLIARERREISRVRDGVAFAGGVKTRSGGLLTLLGRAFTDGTGDLMLTRIRTGVEVAITRLLVTIGSDLVPLGARLIAIRARLIAVRTRLVGV